MPPSATTDGAAAVAAVEALRQALVDLALAVHTPPGAAAHDHDEFRRVVAIAVSRLIQAFEHLAALGSGPAARH